MEFNPDNNRLYIACSPHRNVNTAGVFATSVNGLVRIAFTPIGDGGEDAGGGVAVNRATGHVFFTNSTANTVSLLDGGTNAVIATVPVGVDPFGIAADPTTGLVFVANRLSDDVYVFTDPTAP